MGDAAASAGRRAPHRCPAGRCRGADPDAPVLQALQAGVCALLPGDVTAREITTAIEAAAAGLVALCPATLARLLGDLGPSSLAVGISPEALAEALTAREVDALNMLADDLSNKAIATRRGISEHTVKFHLGAIFGKLGAAGRGSRAGPPEDCGGPWAFMARRDEVPWEVEELLGELVERPRRVTGRRSKTAWIGFARCRRG